MRTEVYAKWREELDGTVEGSVAHVAANNLTTLETRLAALEAAAREVLDESERHLFDSTAMDQLRNVLTPPKN